MIKEMKFKDGIRYAVIINGTVIGWRKTMKAAQKLLDAKTA